MVMLRRYQRRHAGGKRDPTSSPGLVETNCASRRGRGPASLGRDSQRPDASAARATSSNVSGSRPVTSRTVVDTTSISPRAIDV